MREVKQILQKKRSSINKELANGSLNIEKFAYYIEHDTLYLRDFARSLTIIASKAPLKFVKDFLSFSDGALIAEQEVVHSFFRHTFNLQETGKLTPATLSYITSKQHGTSRNCNSLCFAMLLGL
ncbi:hypothetical protein EBS02_07145 [bacterium]|nr:hypothetical protein [bacterium]